MRYLPIEFLRTKRTFTMFLPLVILVCGFLASIIGGQATTAGGIAPLHFYVFVMPALAMTVAVLSESREDRLRAGGTSWRPISRWRTLAARVFVASFYALLGHFCAPLLLGRFSMDFALMETVFFASYYCLGLVLWVLLRAGALVLAPLIGLFSAVFAFYPDSTSVLSQWWALNPFTWHLRASLPVYGVNPNSTAAEPGSPIFALNPVFPTVLSLAGAAVCFVFCASIRHYANRRFITTGSHLVSPTPHRAWRRVASHRPFQVKALCVALPWRLWIVASLIMVAILAATRARYGYDSSRTLYGLLAVPLAAIVVGTTSWFSHRTGWRTLITRPKAGRLFPTLTFLSITFTTVTLLIGGFIAHASPYQLIVTPGVVGLIGVGILLISVWSFGLSIAVGVILMIWSVLVGGDILASNAILWRTGVSAWASMVATYPARWCEMFCVSWTLTIAMVAVASPKMARHTLN